MNRKQVDALLRSSATTSISSLPSNSNFLLRLTVSGLGISIMRAVFFVWRLRLVLGVDVKTLAIGSNDRGISDSSSQIWSRLPLALSRRSRKSLCAFVCRCHRGCYYITRQNMRVFSRLPSKVVYHQVAATRRRLHQRPRVSVLRRRQTRDCYQVERIRPCK